MRQSQLFTKTRKQISEDEISKNAQLLTRAGFVHKEMAGVYTMLPLGLRVLSKIIQIIREEMNRIGGQEITMTALQEKTVWEKTGRWDDAVVDNWFKTQLKNGTDLGLAYTHEPAITGLMKDYILSYRDLPTYAYQFQTKFRNELRAKSGILRGREFLMKDLYSFSANQQELDEFYEKATEAYRRVFERVGLGDKTYLTLASGGTFGTKFSHEFQTITPAGEDLIYIHKEKNIAINKEVLNEETLNMLGISRDELIEEKSIEVGNIYKLGTFYSEPLGLTYTTETGETKPVIMGSYGIGLGRVMGTIVEVHNDDKGIIWPETVAPFAVHLISLAKNAGEVAQANKIYELLINSGVEVLYDNRPDVTAGNKFADSDLLGIPLRVVLSPKTVAAQSVETKTRAATEAKIIPVNEFLAQYV